MKRSVKLKQKTLEQVLAKQIKKIVSRFKQRLLAKKK